MKKIILVIFMITYFMGSSYAINNSNSSCKIKDAPADVLQKFIENQKKVLSNIANEVSGKKDTISLDTLEERFLYSINSIISFDNYFESFQYIVLELTTSVPIEIKRDKTKIENELTKVQNQIEKSIKKRYSGIELTKEQICYGIDESYNCNLTGSTLNVLTEISKNNSRILSLYENSILGQNTERYDFILVQDTFYQEMIQSYNKNTLMDCSMFEGGFFDKLEKTIEKITKYMKSTGKATKYWIDAWNLLTGEINESDLKKIEKDLLAKELARQGLTKEQSAIILENLKKFNDKGGFSTENNYIINSINSGNNFIIKFINFFDDVLTALQNNGENQNTIEISYIPTEIEKKDSTYTLFKEMQKMYVNLNNAAGIQSVVDEKSIDKLIQIHITLSKMISNLENTVEPAQSICNDQCTGVGNCTNY